MFDKYFFLHYPNKVNLSSIKILRGYIEKRIQKMSNYNFRLLFVKYTILVENEKSLQHLSYGGKKFRVTGKNLLFILIREIFSLI